MFRPIARLVAALALLLAGTACGRIEKPMCALPKPEPAALQAMLRDHRFEELEATLRGYQDATDRDRACEGRTWTAFGGTVGGSRRPGWRPHLDAFVAAFPESFVPYAVRGGWGFELGLARRGGKFIGETTPEQIAGMREAFREAMPDLLRALELRPTTSYAWGRVIDVVRTGGSERDLYAAFRRGLAAVPTSHLFREHMLEARAPKWRGSRAEQAALAFDAWTRRAENPRMWFVVGGMFISLGDDWWSRSNRLGLLFYSVALRCDDATSWYQRRAKARRILGDGDGAIADAREILKQLPRDEFAWLLINGVLQDRKDFAGAVRELDAALRLSPASIRLLEHRAYASSKARNMAAAEADYQRLLELDHRSVRFQAYSRFLVEEKRRDFEHAVALMREATELDPLDPENWSHLAGAQYMTGDPGRVQSYERFLELLDTNIPENAERARSIRAYLARGAPPRRLGRRPPREAATQAAAPRGIRGNQ